MAVPQLITMDSTKIFNVLPELWYGKTKDISNIWVAATDTTGTYFLGYVFMPPHKWSVDEFSGLLANFKQHDPPNVTMDGSMPAETEAIILAVWDLFLQLPQFFTSRDDLMQVIDTALKCAQSDDLDQAWAVITKFQIAQRLPIIALTSEGRISACDTLLSRAVGVVTEQFEASSQVDVEVRKAKRISSRTRSVCSSASSTISPLKFSEPRPQMVCIKINSATKRVQNGLWQLCFALRSSSGLIAGQVFRELMPHDDIASLTAIFHHVILKEPVFLTVMIGEPKGVGSVPVAVGVLNMSPVVESTTLTANVTLYKVPANDEKGWGPVLETMISGGASLSYASQIQSLKVSVVTSPAVLPGVYEPGTAQSFILDSFNPQNRIVVTCSNFVLTSDDHRGPYWVEISGSTGVTTVPPMSTRSFPVQNGQSLGRTIEVSGDLAEGALLFKVFNKTSQLFSGTCGLKTLRDGANTVALTSRSLFSGYIKLSARILNSELSYQPTVDRLLSGEAEVNAIPLLSHSTLIQFYRPFLTRTLNSFVQTPGSWDSIASFATMCEISDKAGYLLELYFVVEQIPIPKLLESLLETYAKLFSKCPPAVHTKIPSFVQWLAPNSEVFSSTIRELMQTSVSFIQDGAENQVLAFLDSFVPLLTSLQPACPISQLAEFFEKVVGAIDTRESAVISGRKFLLLAQISCTKILFVGDLWLRVLSWTKSAWVSEDLSTISYLMILVKNLANVQDARFDQVSYLVPLAFNLLNRLADKPAVCVGGELFQIKRDTKMPSAELRGLLICELTIVLGLLLESKEVSNQQEKLELRRSCLDALRVVTLLIEAPVFPKRWISLYALQIRIAVACLGYTKSILPPLPTNPNDADLVDTDIYANFLMLCARLCSLRVVMPNLLYPAEATAVKGIIGDSFNKCLHFFATIWDSLGSYDTVECASGYQIVMVNSSRAIIQHLVQCLFNDSDSDSRDTIGLVLHSIIVPGYSFTTESDATRFLSLLLASIDRVLSGLSKTELPSPEAVLNFLDALNLPDARLSTQIEVFINLSIGYYLYENLFTAGSVLGFCGGLGLMSLFELYTKRICAIFHSNFRVHGLVYMELSKLYAWDDFHVVSAMDFPCLPQQRASGRKRKLVLMAIDCFTKAKEFRLAIGATKHLIKPADECKDYKMLSELSNKLSFLYSKAVSTPELVTHYYLVTFPKHRLPLLSKKQYILDGSGLRIDEIRAALQAEYGIPCYIQDRGAGQSKDCILVKTVNPSDDVSSNSTIGSFFEMIPLPGATGVSDLQVEENVYKCFQSFPSISGMSQVETIQKRILGPLETALRAIKDKIRQFKVLLNKAVERTSGYDIQLEMALAGVITAPVNGGVSQYHQFLSNPEMKSACEELGEFVKLAIEFYSSAVNDDRKQQVDLFRSEFHKVFQSATI